jgi:NAD(P)-dependent dehydrogenase (short-subunit alcohol dehydrogenase family)
MAMNWLITGASSGFGRLMTQIVLARGDRVAGTARKTDALAELQDQHGARLKVIPMELTDVASIRHAADTAFAQLGRIDVVVSNAAYGLFGAAEELTSQQIRHQIDTNLIGSIELIRAVIPHLRAQGGGRVIQVSSEGGQIAYPNFSVYHASKWGIEGFVESVAQEVASFGIRFILAEPGPALTGFGSAIVSAPAMEDYRDTPSGALRRAITDGSFVLKGDPHKFAQAMVDCATENPPPRRLALGAGAYAGIRAALESRLADLEAKKQVSLSSDLA